MSNERPEIELDLGKIINSEDEILFHSMNMRASLDSAKPCFSMYNLASQKGEGNTIHCTEGS